ncbi:ATP-binding protein [Idiomarina piscisalsi]|uniref:ATPase n=1 Tax=Idiomarina piscisalsi TaxID=1096243 RepID=A0A432YTX7_9GAMM|nr:ATP-binding protein [Idiomarina piscisalsi]RUO66773.1 ATPase [Idiomarina piscisalsi]
MNISPIEHSASLRIGSVEFVSPDEIKVGLDLDAPDGIAANAGTPRAFPRINSYVLIATESGFIVSQVEWIAVEKSPFPKRKGFQDYGLIDLPFPLRKMKVSPLGLLKSDGKNFKFRRGVQAFPSVGEPVLIPTDTQLRAIVESGDNRRVKIGTSPIAANADVCIDPDRLFGRHLAILGNTGSGKSCSVAGLIQWSLESAKAKVEQDNQKPNARFIVLDPNGEYSKAFGDQARVFKVGDEVTPLQVPLWFWNSAEWISFTQASPKAQAPLLKRALRAMRNEQFELSEEIDISVRKFLSTILISSKHERSTGAPWGSFPKPKGFYEKICKWTTSVESLKGLLEGTDTRLDDLLTTLDNYQQARSGRHPTYESDLNEVNQLIDSITTAFNEFGGSEKDLLPKSEDTPCIFDGDVFVSYLESLAQETGNEQFVEFLLTRIRTMLADTRMSEIIGDNESISLADWLNTYIGEDNAQNGCVTVIDLSLVPADITHIITAVIARMTFEALQRYRKVNNETLPTVLVMEEAHTFVKRYKEDTENQNAATVCCQVFEKVAREGRKFGLGLVLSSQRPSELSPTVLSQCNSFLLHRISNDRDQELVHRLVPDNLRGLLRELPSLPSQQAILLGWASELPIVVKMNDLDKHQRPHSDDPDYWDVWSRLKDRSIDWAGIANDWQHVDDDWDS